MTMLKLCVLVSCFVLAVRAQTPTRPAFPSTFFASGEVELHVAEETRFGKFTMARDQAKLMSVEESAFDKGDVEKVLQRYDQKKTYFIRGPPGNQHCLSRDRNGVLSPFWEWLERAYYEGKRELHEREIDLWGLTVGDVRFEVGVDPESPNSPAIFNRFSAEDDVLFRFIMFNATTPPATYFTIPSVCEEAKLNF